MQYISHCTHTIDYSVASATLFRQGGVFELSFCACEAENSNPSAVSSTAGTPPLKSKTLFLLLSSDIENKILSLLHSETNFKSVGTVFEFFNHCLREPSCKGSTVPKKEISLPKNW